MRGSWRLGAAGVACGLVLISMAAWPAPPRTPPFIGISVNPPEGGTMQDVISELVRLRDRGMGILYVSHKWSDLERTPGKPDVTSIAEAVRGTRLLGCRVTITIQILDTNNRTLPADLMAESFGSDQMHARFRSLLEAIAPALTSDVYSIQLGNEVDIYLREHPTETEAYARLVEEGRDLLRKARPDMRVGVTTTYEGLVRSPMIFERLNKRMDVVVMTYYPLGPGFAVRPVTDVAGDFGRMVKAAGARPLCLQEAGYPTSPILGSSEEKQAAFVDAVFSGVRKHSARMGYCNFFLLHDFTDSQVAEFLRYYRLPDARFRAYLATLGFKTAKGEPRKAWDRFLAGLGRSGPARSKRPALRSSAH